ncbi:tetratricopeptide repeat protein [Amycolatopsis sp. NPDC059657]|uniref:tetratricopeptide repeat protein n=1 Tax=Amycolatopsis sp. NPDC059657 TaxID=3346899 RepID=UPI00366A6DF7
MTDRQGVYPFCGPCTDGTIASRAPDTQTVNGIGTCLYGAADRCPRCGSVVKRLYFCLLWIPIWPMRSYRIIWVGGSRYVGREVPDGRNPYGFDKKTAALVAQAEAAVAEAQETWPEPPPSRLDEHPELRRGHFRKAERYWSADRPDLALPVYEEVLAAHELVLPADDVATLWLRQRVGEAYLAVGRPVAALALLRQTQAHLKRVLGPGHPDTRRASEDVLNARMQLGKIGLAKEEAEALEEALAELVSTVGPDHPMALRTACALADALRASGTVIALELLEETLEFSEAALGAEHPDTVQVRLELLDACEEADRDGTPDERRTAALIRRKLGS